MHDAKRKTSKLFSVDDVVAGDHLSMAPMNGKRHEQGSWFL